MANKRYDQFTAATPTGSNITLYADPSTGALNKVALLDLFALNPPSLINSEIAALQKLGSPFINLPIAVPSIHATSAHSLINQQGVFTAVYLPAGTVTGIAYVLGTTGTYTANNFNGFALFSKSGSTLTQIAVTANNGNFFKAGVFFWQNAPFAAAVTVTADVYYIGMLWCASATTVTPQPFNINNAGFPWNYSMNTSPSVYLTANFDSITSLAGPFNLASPSGALSWVPMIIPYS